MRSAGRVVDKMPANFWYAGLLHAAFPKARIIHMQRHPFDTCLSIYFQNFFNIGSYAHDLADLAHFYGEYRRVMESLAPPVAGQCAARGALRRPGGRSGELDPADACFCRPAVGPALPGFSPDRSRGHHREQVAGATEDQQGLDRPVAKLREAHWAAPRPNPPDRFGPRGRAVPRLRSTDRAARGRWEARQGFDVVEFLVVAHVHAAGIAHGLKVPRHVTADAQRAIHQAAAALAGQNLLVHGR